MGETNKSTTQKAVEPKKVIGKPFTKSRQPTREQKKAGWERKKQGQEMMDKAREYMKLSVPAFQELFEDIKKHPNKYSVQDQLIYKYVTKAFNSEKFMLDWIDRHVSKAPSQVEGSDGDAIRLIIERTVSDMPDIENEA